MTTFTITILPKAFWALTDDEAILDEQIEIDPDANTKPPALNTNQYHNHAPNSTTTERPQCTEPMNSTNHKDHDSDNKSHAKDSQSHGDTDDEADKADGTMTLPASS